ncbi:hypothetical protein Pan44_31000 [Caulifigura coniformis]|uniref:Uncharacterized protein n=1 Tax=Caulifigura coniformis TaxID=2527983 RepID=A0A517SG02_9PLAN|nr:hypothetical protein [Caulifigura coniformis]QDT55059.1 hypothetical protein Pan44_31000 [Caulifigura coniformis]
MRALKALWFDDSGFVLSAEAVAVGTLGVVGAAVGAGAVARSVNSELEEMAFALRSLDQSYSIPEQRIGQAFVAGSSFTQKPVAEAHDELRQQIQRDREAEEKARLKSEEPEKKPRPGETPRKKKKKARQNGENGDEFEPAEYVPPTI